MSERDSLLNELAEIHEKWAEEMESQVEFRPDTDSNPHDKKTGASDYNQHHVDRSASPEQEQVFRDRTAHIIARLEEISRGESDAELGEKLSKVSTSIDFHVAVNGSAVLMLVKHDFDEGLLSYREGGEWIPATPDDELPALDDAVLIEVIGEATEIWDASEGGELSLSDFKTVLLDGI